MKQRRVMVAAGALATTVVGGCMWAGAPAAHERGWVGDQALPPGALAARSMEPLAAPAEPPYPPQGAGADGYLSAPPPPENEFLAASGEEQVSTFAVDVDTASYALVKRFLRRQQLPPADVVRLEEMINAFDLDDPPPPDDDAPFSTRVEVAGCPWRAGNRLVRVSLRGREVAAEARPASNLVFLIDVSGSMSTPERLPLVKQSLRLLVEQLREQDRVAIVVYAGASGLVLPPTSGGDRGRLLAAIERLQAGGSTNGGAGIQLAYRTAVEAFIPGGVNRVILCTDGDFNVGARTPQELERLIEEKRRSGVFLTCLGFGIWGGDRTMETLANRGNGHYAVIDDLRQAERALVDELSGTLVTIAKDVKVQVAWNPARVRRYRLLGYENRLLATEDFVDDEKDGGEIGAGHRVTALYEVEPVEGADPAADLLTLRLRWKAPDGEASVGVEQAARDAGTSFDDATTDLKFLASVAAGGMLLRRSPHAGDATVARALRWAEAGLGKDPRGDRAEWLDLLRRAARVLGEDAGHAALPGRDGRG
ncbi:MAG: VWA domain-containing protein [Planctomycetes bacterium]|nr:VWA domain-containing protein [Planctomycetota bacterium]